MKKTICIVLTLAMLFAFAACTKKGEQYVEPPTEIISFENGSTAVYEVVTDDKGEAVTDENGETEVVPYDPPVTEKGGYLVTNAEGSTIKQSKTTAAFTAAVENDFVDLDDTTAPTKPTTTLKGETTAATTAATTAKPNATTKPAATTAGGSLNGGTGETTTKNYVVPTFPEAQTKPLGNKLSKDDASTLVSILSIDNTFDQALCEPDYYKAEKELKIYIESIEEAIAKIKADKKLYKFVGDENLNQWLGYMVKAQDEYAVFMGIVRGTEGEEKKPATYYTAYENFQNTYRQSLKVLFFMKSGAEEILYSA